MFIDCFSRYTWLYLLKHKSDVLSVFRDLCALIKNQHEACIKVLRLDNGTEYVNQDFEQFLALHGIEHQTTCVKTLEQNGVAERKNRQLLEVARSIMFTMNIPKFLWGEAIKTATYLINRMPLRILSYKTPAECLLTSNDFIVPPKVFGCVCFVHDYRNYVGKLDPRALKCVFVGYSPSKKGYKCWCPSEHQFVVSMDVTFWENESYYSAQDDSGITKVPTKVQQEGESENNGFVSPLLLLVPTSGGSLIHDNNESQGVERNNGDYSCHGDSIDATESSSLPSHNGDDSGHGDNIDATESSSRPSLGAETSMHMDPGTTNNTRSSVAPICTTRHSDNQLSIPTPQDNLPIALRKPTRTKNTPGHLKDFVGYKHDIANFISYKYCSPSFQSFIASLDSISVPSHWK
jgi:hypothetical protein